MREEDEKKLRTEEMIQRVVDPFTGRDMTSEVISQRLKELEIIAEAIVQGALAKYIAHPDDKKAIYEDAYWEIHHKLGQGSIGPATAAAGPLMYSKMDELADKLEIDEKERM